MSTKVRKTSAVVLALVFILVICIFSLKLRDTKEKYTEPIFESSHTKEKYTKPIFESSLPSIDSDDARKNVAITGGNFSGRQVRNFIHSKIADIKVLRPGYDILGDKSITCKKWAVLTTINSGIEAVRRQVQLSGWSLVIVADIKSPKGAYDSGWVRGQGNNHVVYLSVEDQESMNNEFVQHIPWNHFGRKNIGYLYALQHGADVVWDFDDDNVLKFFIEGAAPPGAPNIDTEVTYGLGDGTIDIKTPKEQNYPTYNPYPNIGAPSFPSWPRGLPLQDIREPQSYNTTLQVIKVKKSSIGVLQSLAEVQPDVDAIYRLTMEIPFTFKRSKESKPLLIPRGVLTPYNAQATIHFKSAFWGLYLPISVTGRVSDVWRSYITQRILWDCGLYAGYSARPLVVQNRNVHEYVRDFAAEQDLYTRSQQLVTFLGEWKSSASTLVERIQELWIALYEREYIEEMDVILVQSWLSALIKSRYKFPKIVSDPLNVPKYHRSTHTQWLSALMKSRYKFPKIVSDPLKYHRSTHSQLQSTSVEGNCKLSKSLTFWTSDLHDGTRMDVPTILAAQNHKVLLGGHKKSVPHKNVLQHKGISIYNRLSPTIRTYTTHSTRLTESMIIENYEFYKQDKEIEKTDAFFCQFPASMCEMWMPFNKSIVFAPAHRYNLGRCTKEEWDRLNQHLYMLASSPRHVIGALSFYDKEYLEHYTGLNVAPLYSYSGFYTDHVKFNPIRKEILVVSHANVDDYIRTIKKFKLSPLGSVYKHYELSDLGHHRAVVYFPYSVMSYKLTELYSMKVPLFMPSMRYYHTHPFGNDRTSVSSYYCNNPGLDTVMKPHSSSMHVYSPNSNEPEAEFYWLQLSDFFYWPYITYFDNATDLEQKLERVDFQSIHDNMVKEIEKKTQFVVNNWCKVAQRITTGRIVPQNYNEGIRSLYNVSRLQVG